MAKPPPVPPPVPPPEDDEREATLAAFGQQLLDGYTLLKKTDRHELPTRDEYLDYQRHGKCWSLCQALAAALADVPKEDRTYVLENLGRSETFVQLAYEALSTGF